MSGNGQRAARRVKALSKPLPNGKSPFEKCFTTTKKVRRMAHHVERQFINRQLAALLVDVIEFFHQDIEVAKAVFEEPQAQEIDWMPLRVRDRHYASVEVSRGSISYRF